MATIVALKGWNSSLTAWNSGTWNGEGASWSNWSNRYSSHNR